MRFLSRKTAPVEEGFLEESDESTQVAGESAGRGRARWSTTFLVVGSALLGATAIAFWNRRTIANMRAQLESAPQSVLPSRAVDRDIY